MSATAQRDVAAFDFDGTITRGDTLLPFLRSLCGAPALLRALGFESTASMRSTFRRGATRDAFKAAVLARLLAGWPLADVETTVAEYTSRVVRSRLRPDIVARVGWHRDQGHELVVVSASPEIYVAPIAAQLGFDAVLATRLEVVDGRLTGRLSGPNVRGAEKVARVRRHLEGDDVRLWAYGDSAGDRELLAAAEVAIRVTRSPLAPSPGTAAG